MNITSCIMNSRKTFKEEYSFSERQKLASDLISHYRTRIPMIVERYPNSYAPQIRLKKWSIPRDFGFEKLMHRVRAEIDRLGPEESLFFFVSENGVMVPPTYTIEQIYEKHKDKDGFLYLYYDIESTFGSK